MQPAQQTCACSRRPGRRACRSRAAARPSAGCRPSARPPGLPFGTMITSLLVANVTGREQSPSLNSARASSGLAEAKTSAGPPRSIWACSVLEPPKLYDGEPVIAGKASRSDDAA